MSEDEKDDIVAIPSGMSDDELGKIHSELNKDKHPPTVNFLRAPLVFVFLFGCLVFACAIQLAHTTNQFSVHPPKPAVNLTPEQVEEERMKRKLASGLKIYNSKCIACHQSTGLGQEGQYPPLRNSRWVLGDAGIISKIVLKGLKGEIQVLGKTYGTAIPMPPPPDLNDRAIADVVTYVRQAWDNNASEVTEEQVSVFREEVSGRTDLWSGPELMELYPDSFSEN